MKERSIEIYEMIVSAYDEQAETETEELLDSLVVALRAKLTKGEKVVNVPGTTNVVVLVKADDLALDYSLTRDRVARALKKMGNERLTIVYIEDRQGDYFKFICARSE